MHFDSSSYTYNSKTKELKYQNTSVSLKEYTISSSVIFYNKEKNFLKFGKDTVIDSKKFILFADSGFLDENTHHLSLYQVSGIDLKTNLRIYADQVERRKDGSFIISNVTLSYCKIGDELWDIQAKELYYHTNDFAKEKGAVIRLFKIPVFYVPFFVWSTQIKKKSGFLTPKMKVHRNSNNLLNSGLHVQIPYYLALSQDQDLTLTLHSVQKRGEGLASKYRYHFRKNTFGEFNTFLLYESRFIRSTQEENIASVLQGSNTKQHARRYLYHWQDTRELGGGQLYIDSVANSDNQILYEYFDEDNKLIEKYHHYIDYAYNWVSGGIVTGMHKQSIFTNESVLNKTTDSDTHLNRLPYVELYHSVFPFYSNSFLLGTKLGYTYYNRKYGWNTSTITIDTSFSYAFNLSFLHFYPKITRQFSFNGIGYKPDPTQTEIKDLHANFFIDTAEVETNFTLYHFFYTDQQATSKIQITPRLIYRRVTDRNQRDLLDKTSAPNEHITHTPADYAKFDPMFSPLTYGENNLTARLDFTYLKKNQKENYIFPLVGISLIQQFDLMNESDSPFLSERYKGPRIPLENRQISPHSHALPLNVLFNFSTESNYQALLSYRYNYQTHSILETEANFSSTPIDRVSFGLTYHNNKKEYQLLNGDLRKKENTYTLENNVLFLDKLSSDISATWDTNRTQAFFDSDPSHKRLHRQLTAFTFALHWIGSCYVLNFNVANKIQEHTQGGDKQEYIDTKFSMSVTSAQFLSSPVVNNLF